LTGKTERGRSVRHYFVDEAGDGTLFDSKGRIIVGVGGCSRYFILGVLDVVDPEGLLRDFSQLRARLLADPYFQKVPSMQPQAKKTAVAFHAKDDVPEVRREVFALLRSYELRLMAVVRDKHKVVEYARQRKERDPNYRYHPNELYDYLVRRLFKNLLHKEDEYHIYFARRGKADRTAALRDALEAARGRFASQTGLPRDAQVNIYPRSSAAAPPGAARRMPFTRGNGSAASAGLQAADYFLWSLQRLYERGEDRYVELLWPAFRLVHDIDDTREARYGVYYTQRKPLTAAALMKTLPGI